MKPTQIAELFANIKKTFVSFFSILMFVALGVGIFLGISWSGPALRNAADVAFDEGAFHNFQVLFSYGMTDDDIAKIGELEGVTDVEGARQSIQTLVIDSKNRTIKVQTIGERINTLTVLEGELPAHPNEIALNASDAKSIGINLGDTITFEKDSVDSVGEDVEATESASNDESKSSPDEASASSGSESGASASSSSAAGEKEKSESSVDAASADDSNDANSDADSDGMSYLNVRTFKVTAFVQSPEYLAETVDTHGNSGKGAGTIHLLSWVLPDAFDGEAFSDAYPIVNVRCEGLDGKGTFSDDYKNDSSQIEARISDLGKSLAKERCDSIRGDAQKSIDESQAKLDDARKQVADGEKAVEQAKKDIKDGEKKIKDGEVELENARKEVSDGEAQLANARAELSSKSASGKKKLDQSRAKIQSAQSEYDKKAAEVNSARADVNAMQSQVSAAQGKVQAAQAAYDQAVSNLSKHSKPEEISESAIGGVSSKDGSKASKKASAKKSESVAALKAKVDKAYAALQAAQSATVSISGDNMTLAEAQQAVAVADATVSAAEQELATKKAQLDAGWVKYNNAKAKYDSEISKANAEISKYESELADAKNQVAQGEQELEDTRTKVKDGKKELEEKTKELEDAKKKIESSTKQLDEAKRNLENMKDADWSVASRSYNVGAAQVSMFSDVMGRLSLSMAALFIIVGLLVSYSAVSRIVHEQITQIGTKKALGLRGREITTSFLAYSALAVVSGSVIGTIVGVIAVEGIIGNSLASMFTFDGYPPYFGLPLFLGVTALEIVLVLGATWLACHTILREHAIELLKGEKPPEGKTRFYENWGAWDKLPLFTQTIVNNCMNDKRRVFSTIVGVAGCTALIVTALTLNDDVLASFDRHYKDVYGFDAIAYADDEVDDSLATVQKALGNQGDGAVQARIQSFLVDQPDGDRGTIRAVISSDAAFTQVYGVNLTEGEVFDAQGEGVWVSQAYANHQGAKLGDEITVDAGDGAKHKLPILGFYEFWLTQQEMVMGYAYYEKEFEQTSGPNAFLFDSGGEDIAALETSLADTPGLLSIDNDKAKQKVNFDMFADVSRTVVLVYLVLAVLMAIVVLLNLNVMFIEEKKRDLIVLMINGFSTRDAKRYIYNDTIALTIIGIVAGLVLGCIVGSVTVGSVEPAPAMFVKDVDPIAVAVGIVGSGVLALVMSIIALRRIPRFNLTDINKV